MSVLHDPSNAVLAKARAGVAPDPEGLLSFLSVPEGSERAERLSALSAAFAEAGKIEQAATLAHRAFAVSRHDPRYLDACTKLLAQSGDIDGLRDVLKRAGLAAAKEGKVIEALNLFNRSLYAHATHRKEDRYVYDFEMLAAIDAMAQPFRQVGRSRPIGQHLRIAVLVFGTLHVGSVIIKLLATFAEHADHSRFEVAFFVPEGAEDVRGSESAKQQLGLFERAEWSVHIPVSNSPLNVVLDTATAIRDWRPDVLLTGALCADLRHYFIASMQTAPKKVALVLGPPPQFTVPWVDWNIAVSAHPALDTPGNCSVIPLELTLPSRRDVTVEAREQYGIAPGKKIIASAGRSSKFESGRFWRAIAEILSSHSEAVYLAMGVSELAQEARESLPGDLLDRVRPVGWRKDYLGVLGLADVVLDTYPSGGGVVLLDAMALGIPTVSMANDYLHEFDQTDWALGNEIVVLPELVVPRHDFARLVSVVDKLLTDLAEHARLGRECEALVRSQRGSPDRMIRRWEQVLNQVTGRPQSVDGIVRDSSPFAFSQTGLARVLRWLGHTPRTQR